MKSRNRIWAVVLSLAMVCSLSVFAPGAVYGAEESGGGLSDTVEVVVLGDPADDGGGEPLDAEGGVPDENGADDAGDPLDEGGGESVEPLGAESIGDEPIAPFGIEPFGHDDDVIDIYQLYDDEADRDFSGWAFLHSQWLNNFDSGIQSRFYSAAFVLLHMQ